MSDGAPARGRFPAGFRFAAEEDFPRVEELWLEAFPEDTAGDVRDFLLSRYTAEKILLRCENGHWGMGWSMCIALEDGVSEL